MVDFMTQSQRKSCMSNVKGKNTKPEMALRSLLHNLGFRFRLHRKNMPGKLDIVLPKYKTVIFVNGCFWHQHEGCKKATIPQTNKDFWIKKLQDNRNRDIVNVRKNERLGWKVITVWECEIKELESLKNRLSKELILQIN